LSTGADNKTMPVTPEYAEGHARIFGERKRAEGVERRIYVMRCSGCDGVEHDPDAKLYLCGRCKQWTCASMDAATAPPLFDPTAEAKSAPIMVDRFYENTVAIDGKTDIGSRKKYREYLKQTGFCHASDFSKETIAKNREAHNQELRRDLQQTAERVMHERWKP
jgi:hypothetical protein